MKPAISIEKLGKSYKLSHRSSSKGYRTLRESLAEIAAAPLRTWRARGAAQTEEFWALKDVSLEVEPGEVLGIVGRNGSGKSTLLKILSRITNPTTGQAALHGRVGSLLEVGTGFHPELSGRENVFLNGSILGMSRSEIQKEFDAIVQFAEVEKFLDTPVKRYSSGMYVRLAFAVAAHLQPEILIVDEVLAVGDAQFQNKCLGKMSEVARSGRTVVFVSHNHGAVRQLCTSALCLAAGRVIARGPVLETLAEYARRGTPTSTGFPDAYGRELISVERVGLVAGKSPVEAIATGEDFSIEFQLAFLEKLTGSTRIGLAIESPSHGFMLINYSHFQDIKFQPRDGIYRARFDRFPIAAGEYHVHLRIEVGCQEVFWSTHLFTLSVHAGDFFRTGARGEEALCPWLYEVAWTSEA